MNIARISPLASEQISEIWDYLEDAKKGLGDDFFQEFASIVQVIEHHPEAFQRITPGIRRAVLKRFRYAAFYFYTADPPVLEIIEVLHQSSNPDAWPRR
jgi:plasmid stabilization system protein ParE